MFVDEEITSLLLWHQHLLNPHFNDVLSFILTLCLCEDEEVVDDSALQNDQTEQQL